MELTRRQFMIGSAATGAAVATTDTATAVGGGSWSARTAADMPEPDIETLLLHRAAFGPRPRDMQHIRDVGAAAWIEEQLDYESIDDSQVEEALRSNLPTLSHTPKQILDYRGPDQDSYRPSRELILATLYRMAFSKRLLYEVMVEFWSDHFHISIPTGLARYFKPIDDRDVIRPHALGKFRDLLTASAQSPAMLNYLDNDVSTRFRPNENYAREIMELHTLGVAQDGEPYTETDVYEVARAFTGWTWVRSETAPDRGEFTFNNRAHDQSPKTVLGHQLSLGLKEQDGHEVIRILCEHPATARFLATKMVRRFVTDDPQEHTPELVERVADTYTRTDGDIREMVRAILRSQEFSRSFATYGGRLSRPMDLLIRMLRVTDMPADRFDLTGGRGNRLQRRIDNALQAMGHRPFYWTTPDGYPDVKEAWSSSANILTRWNLGLALCGAASGNNAGIGGQLVTGWDPTHAPDVPSSFATVADAADWWIDRLLHRPMRAEDRAHVIEYLSDGKGGDTPYAQVTDRRMQSAIALIVDSPYFQWR